MSAVRQQHLVVTIPAGQTVNTDITLSEPADRLTIWVNSGRRVLASASFQLQVNKVNYGSALSFTAERAADVLYRSGGASAENDLIPVVAKADQDRGADPMALRVAGSNAGASSITVTVHVVYVAHAG